MNKKYFPKLILTTQTANSNILRGSDNNFWVLYFGFVWVVYKGVWLYTQLLTVHWTENTILPLPPKMYMFVPTAVAEWKSRHLAGLPWRTETKYFSNIYSRFYYSSYFVQTPVHHFCPEYMLQV